MTEKKGASYQRQSSRAGGAAGTFLITLLLVVAIGVFVYSGWRLISYYLDYKQGSDEYSDLNEEFVNHTVPQTTAAPETTAPEGNAPGQTESVPSPSGEALADVSQLENPAKRTEILEGAHREDTVENGETKALPKLKNPVDFAQLQEINPEVIGWIRVGAINVSYPVTQAEDNSYYLHRTFKKVDNFAGCIFENCDNSPYFTDQNTILYGHNMKNGSMFGQLKKFSEQETVDKNPYFWIFTKNFIYQYRIFSSSVVNKMGDPYIIRFSEEDFQKYIDKSIASSEIDCGDVEVTTDDRIVTLSTCTGTDATRRILQGVLEQVYIAV